jgi:tRNA uridine 5-carboxymethylaminomethyl modification enzyme
MVTSRAEFRTLLRQDNADLRLTEMSYRMGLATQERMEKLLKKKEQVSTIKNVLQQLSFQPEEINHYLEQQDSSVIDQKQKAIQILLRPNIDLQSMAKSVSKIADALNGFTDEAIEQAEIQIKYEVYIEKEKELVKRMSQLEQLKIPENFNYDKITALSNEALQKFKKIKPETLGQASRISGVNPSDVQILMVYMGR